MLSAMPATSFAQLIPSATQTLKAYPYSTSLFYNIGTDLNTCTIPSSPMGWGLDAAWISSDNVTRGTNWMGKDVITIGRVSFQPSDLVDADGNLSASQQNYLKRRLNAIYISGTRNVAINCDHEVLMNPEAYPNCDKNYANYNHKPYEWYRVIKASVMYCRKQGFNVVTVSPFNEPDYTAWKEGTVAEFKEIAKYISEDPDLAGIRICAGNSLNCDKALTWYNGVKPYVTEGNTHQLAGEFNTFANFWQTVAKDGNVGTADELHNVGEAFIGAHYGMNNGIWWGYEAGARGLYCRASHYGKEIGYAENRKSWTAATVYKWDDPVTKAANTLPTTVMAFLGSSERQASTAAYEFFNTDRPAYYDGVGPTYNYYMEVPGGTGYQSGQTNSERMIQVNYGEDVPCEPIAGGTFVIMNVNSKKCLGYVGGVTSNGTNLAIRNYTGTSSTTKNQWNVIPIDSRKAADFSYFYLENVSTKHYADLLNWGTAPNVKVCGYKGGLGSNELWVAIYAGDGNYYIRSKHSGHYLEVEGGKTTTDALIVQNTFTGSDNQKWRFMPVNARLETTAPVAPTDVTAKPTGSHIHLSWTASADTDVAGYMIQRSENGTDWDVIGRMIAETEFIDNSAIEGKSYQYRIKAVDVSRNISAASEASATIKAEFDKQLIARYCFDKIVTDTTDNHFDAVVPVAPTYNSLDKKQGAQSVTFNGTSNYMMLPPAAVTHPQMTIAFWAKNTATNYWQRIFDFGNGTDQYMFFTLSTGEEMRFVMKNGGEEQILSTTKAGTNAWHHYAITIADDAVKLYIDGVEKVTSTDIKLRPTDINPKICFLGRSQFANDPLYKGYIDDMQIYNFPLTAEEVLTVYGGEVVDAISDVTMPSSTGAVYGIDGIRTNAQQRGINIIRQGNTVRKVLK